MPDFATKRLPETPDAVAPDGMDVRVLLALHGGSMAHFQLAPGETARAVRHRTVEEIWYVLGGTGEMWRKLDNHEEVVPVSGGTCLTIPLGTHFQLRSVGDEPLSALGVTIPRWPGEGEAYEVAGPWTPTRSPG